MNKEILVIDDNPDIRFLICNILEDQNFKVRSAANYDQAVLEINKRLPDLAIIDIKLDKPDKDGIDLLKLVIKKNITAPVKAPEILVNIEFAKYLEMIAIIITLPHVKKTVLWKPII